MSSKAKEAKPKPLSLVMQNASTELTGATKIEPNAWSTMFAQLAMLYPSVELPDGTSMMFYEMLKQYSALEVAHAFKMHAFKSKWFPTVAELVEHIRSARPCNRCGHFTSNNDENGGEPCPRDDCLFDVSYVHGPCR